MPRISLPTRWPLSKPFWDAACRREKVSVRTFEPVSVSHQRRLEIAGELRKYFAEVDANRKPVTEEEAEEIITEAMRSARPGYRPHR
jgi:hypothetical protein